MGTLTEQLTTQHQEFINKQQIFFVATVGNDTKINLSPKGIDTFRILDANHVVWLNLTGSGSETSAHLLENTRMTIMFCSFDQDPLIVRLYGHATTIAPDTNIELLHLFPEYTGVRQLFKMQINGVLSSCGFGVPRYQFIKQREKLIDWSNNKGEDALRQYQKQNNMLSLNNKPTGLEFQKD